MLPVQLLSLAYKPSAAVSKFRFVKIDGDQSVAPVAAVTDQAHGVAQVDVSAAEVTSGKAVEVRVLGISFVEAAAAITRGAFVAPSANGRGQTAVATQYPMGIALKAAGAAGDLIPVLLLPYLNTAAKV